MNLFKKIKRFFANLFIQKDGEEEQELQVDTETESKDTLDWAAEVFRKLYDLAHEDAEYMHHSPHHAQIGRPDEVLAARQPVLRYKA